MDHPAAAPAPEESFDPARALHGRRVLLVAADEFDRLLATGLLEDGAGAIVLAAADVGDAVQVLRTQPVDAILLGLDLLDAEGAERVRRLSLHAAAAGCPIVAMAAPGDAALPPGATDGVAQFVARPLHPATLFEALASCLSAAHGAAAGAPATAANPTASVSFALGLQRCLGRRELYDRVALRFLEQDGQSVRGIGDALEQGDRKSAVRLAHSLISTAGTLGATPLSEGARALYAALAEGHLDGAALLGPLAVEDGRVREALREHLRASGAQGGV